MEPRPNTPPVHLVAVAEGEHDAWYDRELASASEGFLGEAVDASRLTGEQRDAIAASTGFAHTARKAGLPFQSCRCSWIRVEGQRVGTVAVWDSPASTGLRIASLYIDPLRRGQGIATKVIAMVQETSIVNGFEGVSLEAHWTWPRAVGLYLKLGFRVRHWKRSLSLFRRPNLDTLRIEATGDAARLFIGEQLSVTARREGDQLHWEEVPESVDGPDAEGALPTFALHLARAGFPLVRSREHWRASLGSDVGGPESLARRIVAWEAEARSEGWQTPTQRIPGLTYRSLAELTEPAVGGELRVRLAGLLEGAGLHLGAPDTWLDAAETPVLSVTFGGRGPGRETPARECIEPGAQSASVVHYLRNGEAWHMGFHRERLALDCGVELYIPALYAGLDLDPP